MRVRALFVALAVAAAGSPAVAAGGSRPPAEGYALHCSGCHGLDGRGAAGVAPTLHGLAKIVAAPGGRAYVARVPGVAQAPVGDLELAALLNWVLASFSATPPSLPFSAAELAELRTDPLPARPRLPE